MNGLNYLLQTNLYLALFMGFYVLVLRNETFFRQNRIYLNTSIFLSFIIPFISTDWFRDLFITQKVRETAIIPSWQIYETIVVGNEDTSAWTVSNIIFWIYMTGALLFLTRFLLRLAALKSSLKSAEGAAFSFFNIMVIDRNLPEAATIIDHEKVHSRQFHSADIIFIELTAVINWFNPVIYLYKNEIRHIHEFIADEETASLMQSKSDYAALLFSNAMGVAPNQLINNFFNKSLLQRRIIMLNKNKSRRPGLWKYGFSAPLFVLMLIVSAATGRSHKTITVPVLLNTAENSSGLIIPLGAELSKPDPEIKADLSMMPITQRQNSVHDFTALKRHIQRTIKYPASARENNITGYVITNFTIRAKKITDVRILQSLNKDIDNEVVKSLSSYQNELDIPDDSYAIALVFKLVGSDVTVEPMPNISTKNFAGQIIVMAMGKQEEKTANIPISNDESVKDFSSIDVFPEFPGGIGKWSAYLQSNLRYPAQARNNNIQGRVILGFTVNKDGSLSDIKVLRGLGSGLDEEAVKALANSPKWKPGIKDGRAVNVAFTVPISFNLGPKPAEEIPTKETNN